MDYKRHTTEEKIKICEEAIKAEKKGISLFKFSKDLDISNSTLYGWMTDFKKTIFSDDADIPYSLMTTMTEELNGVGSVKIEMVDVLVYSESIENHIYVSVEKPDTNDVDAFNDEIDKRVMDKLQWCFSMKGFKSKME